MDFLTLHELSVQSDIPVRVLRYRLRQLMQAGKLTDGADYRRDDFVDDTHFVWRINPASLMGASGYHPVSKPATQDSRIVSKSDAKPPALVTSAAPGGSQTLANAATNPPGIEREIIDLLKDQVRVKDGQIADLTGQTKTLTALNEKLTGAVVHQSDQIKKLLHLTGGKSDLNEFVTKPGRESVTTDNTVANDDEPMGASVETHGARKAA